MSLLTVLTLAWVITTTIGGILMLRYQALAVDAANQASATAAQTLAAILFLESHLIDYRAPLSDTWPMLTSTMLERLRHVVQTHPDPHIVASAAALLDAVLAVGAHETAPS